MTDTQPAPTVPDEAVRPLSEVVGQPFDVGLIAELSEEDRQKLPAEWHRPHWDGMGTPHFWICTACWGEGWQSGWPCDAATKGGRELAQATGMSYSW